MAELGNYRKNDLKTLAYEFGVDILATDRIIDIIGKLESSPNFDKKLALEQMAVIVEERKAKEEEEKEKTRREFELEKIRLSTQGSDTDSVASSRNENSRSVSLKAVMQKFDPEKSDMALFLTLFQRQAKKAQIEEIDWVTHLLALLPIEIAEIIMREPEDKMENFEHVKKLLLDRFKLSPEAFRTKFVQHQRRPGALWKDLIFELRSYLSGWLQGLQVEKFEDLKNLMITDQIKRRASPEMKDSLIDSWTKFVDPDELASKLDEFELVRKDFKKPYVSKNQEGKGVNKSNGSDNTRPVKKAFDAENSNRKDESYQKDKLKLFEARKPLLCFICSSPDHLKYSCPKLKENRESFGFVSHLSENVNFNRSFAPYLSKARVNGKKLTLCRDTGSSYDVASESIINAKQLTNSFVYLKQPLDTKFRRLPVAEIELEIENLGVIKTKAAVVDRKVKLNHYLLGNKTQKLIDARKKQLKLIDKRISREPSEKGSVRSILPPKHSSYSNGERLKADQSLIHVDGCLTDNAGKEVTTSRDKGIEERVQKLKRIVQCSSQESDYKVEQQNIIAPKGIEVESQKVSLSPQISQSKNETKVLNLGISDALTVNVKNTDNMFDRVFQRLQVLEGENERLALEIRKNEKKVFHEIEGIKTYYENKLREAENILEITRVEKTKLQEKLSEKGTIGKTLNENIEWNLEKLCSGLILAIKKLPQNLDSQKFPPGKEMKYADCV